MNQYENQKHAGSGRSRAKGSSRSNRSTSSSGRAGGSGYTKSSSTRSGASSRSTGSGKRRNSGGHGGGSDFDFMKLAIGGVVLIAAIACIVFLVKGMSGKVEAETEPTTVEETELQKEVTVDGINITGMSREDAKAAILQDFTWGMKVTWQESGYDVADLMAGKVDSLLEEIYAGEPKESYSLDTSGLEEAARAEAANVAAQWDKKARNGSISSYDSSSGKFLFTGAENGQAVDQEKLTADIVAALGRKDFDAVIEATVNTVEPEFNEETARERYKTLSSFTTKTTSNSKRNTNIKLSAQALNGTVLHPGEEFSFNGVVGERTEAKGYKGAAAYNNGEVVEEIGGGVCQLSSTLYNAVLKAGLKTTVRRSHTYEPSYVTPGTDATVSWGGPDYKFVNNSSAAIGIRASYSDQTVTVSIYGIPILEEGVTYALKSAKIKDMDAPAPTYEEDPTLEPGIEKTKSSGSQGSYWETRLVITRNGEVVSQDVDHTVTYRGHAPVILRNTSGTVAPTEPTETTVAESIIDPNQPVEGEPGEPEGPVTGPGGGPGVSGGGQTSETPGNSVVTGPGGGSVGTPTTGAETPTTGAPAANAPTTGAPVTSAPAPAPTQAPAGGNAPGAPTGGSDGPQLIAPMPGA